MDEKKQTVHKYKHMKNFPLRYACPHCLLGQVYYRSGSKTFICRYCGTVIPATEILFKKEIEEALNDKK
jgi:ribosomal protein S27E